MIQVLPFQVQDRQRGVWAAAIDAEIAAPLLALASLDSLPAELPYGAEERSR